MTKTLNYCLLVAIALLSACSQSTPPTTPVRVYAAASLADAMQEASDVWQAQGHAAPQLVLAGSATLARQLRAGAPADVFVSADSAWMDSVEQGGRLAAGQRFNWLGNSLVLIAPRDAAISVQMRPDFAIAQATQGHLCTGEPDVVPVGRYAKQALQHLGWWQALQGRIVGTEDVRAALALVERGECALGIVYGSDANASDKVQVLGTFATESHAPIVYPLALLADASDEGRAFAQFLRGDANVRASFEAHGFTLLAD